MDLKEKFFGVIDFVLALLPTKRQVIRFVSSKQGKRRLLIVAGVIAFAIWVESDDTSKKNSSRTINAQPVFQTYTDPYLACQMYLSGIPPSLVNTQFGRDLYFDKMEMEHQMRVDELESQRHRNAVGSRVRADLSQLHDNRASRMAPQYVPNYYQRTSDGTWVTHDPNAAISTGTDYLPYSTIQEGKKAGVYR